MKRYETADRRLRARLDAAPARPPDVDALFDRVDERRTFTDRLPNYWYTYRRRIWAAWLLLGIGALLGWGSYIARQPAQRTASSRPATAPAVIEGPAAPSGPAAQPRAEVAAASAAAISDGATGPATAVLSSTTTSAAAENPTRDPAAAQPGVGFGFQKPIPDAAEKAAGKAPTRPLADRSAAPNEPGGAEREPVDKPTSVPTASRRAAAPEALSVPAPSKLARLSADLTIKCGDFRAPTEWRTQVEVLVGPELSFRTLQSRTVENDLYAYNRRRTERPWYTAQTQLRVSMQSSRGWVFRTGLSLTDRHEKLDYAAENAERISIENVYDPSGNLLRTDTVTQRGQRVVRWDNRYRRFDVPLLAGYAWRMHPFDVHLNAGVLLNVWADARGRRLASDGATLTSDWSDYRMRLLPDAYLSAGFNYRLANRWTVQLEPQLRYQFGSLTLDAAPLRQQYASFGLLTGWRYQF